MIIDLSVSINNDIPVYTGTPKAIIKDYAVIENDGYAEKLLTLSTHAGTHIDMPAHFFIDGIKADSFPLNMCIGTARCVDAVMSEQKIIDINDWSDLDGNILIVRTNSNIESDNGFFTSYPYFDENLIEKLIKSGIKLLGTASPSVDGQNNYPCHNALLGANIPIVELLTNLNELPERFLFAAAPLKITDGDASPVRAWAMVE